MCAELRGCGIKFCWTASSPGDRYSAKGAAQAAWDNRAEVDGLPLFGADWTRPVTAPAPNQSRDLSIQLSGWMLLEADYRLTSAGR